MEFSMVILSLMVEKYQELTGELAVIEISKLIME